MADTDYDIRTLNSLIATTLDSVNGYTESAKDVDNPRYVSLFNDRAAERGRVIAGLQQAVRAMGGTPEDDGTALAGAHRVFVDLKSAITGKDDKAIVAEVERGEDHILHKFQDALNDSQLSPAARAAVQEAFTSVREGHDQMRDIKRGMQAAQ